MNFLDKIILPLSPGWAASRARSRNMAQAYYEAAEYSRTRKVKAKTGSADQHNRSAQRSILEQARYLDENYDIFSGVLDTLVNNTVGKGLIPEFHVKTVAGELAEDVNKQLAELFEDWAKHPEVTGEYDYATSQRLAARALFRDGEIFAQYLTGAIPFLDHSTVVPFSLEYLESELCPQDYDDENNSIVQGVKKNAWGRPTEYMFYKHHPSETYNGSIFTDFKTIKAERVQHIKMTKRFRQTRGISVAAPVITRFDDIKDIEESERVAARIAAAVVGHIKKGLPEMWQGEKKDSNGDPVRREFNFEPGMIFDDLGPGEGLEINASNRPNNQVIQFRDANMRAAASGVMATYSSISKDYNGTYSAQRQELVEGYQNYAALSGYFAGHKVIPDMMRFMTACYESGLVKLGPEIAPLTMFNVDVVPPQMPWIDPKKEAEAWITLLDNDLESRSHISRQRGRKPQVIREQIEREKDWPTHGLGDQPEPELQPEDKDNE